MLKIMVIDDHAAEREQVEQIAKSLAGVEWMGGFASPQDALQEAVKNVPDVVIAAVELTDMNGLAFTGKLQEILPSVHVIVSSRSGRYAREAYDAGARAYLIKPVGKANLMRALDHVRTISLHGEK